ncbi:serine/threonine protein kinase [Streptomyces sp. 3213]|uniref:serine/threonine protein kinase n=1 Tax=Streptomyces sp. 3213.3 TaxID=1855348 RepID=UPI00089D9A9B|nr:serine/threonine-protein kinase [Streptomyces sp. 3213.3]SEE41127.1 serine/threonine protein kinase [Streptomyces sp. 3213] [Streptomyces sp. 3213.3]
MLTGTLLDGRYRVLRKLGHGGEAEIFVARDENLGCEVAVKSQFSRTFESTTAYVSAAFPMEEELERLTFMRHVPGIPRVLGDGHYGQYQGRYIVMELIEGDTVASWISDHQPVAAAAAVSVVSQLCEILGGVHGEGYVHRDVSAKNTMLQPDGRVRLLDVGISGKIGETSENHRGTPGYAPPEQYDRTAVLAPQVDVFSLGALLFAMIGPELPYSGLEGPPDATTPAFPNGYRAEMPEPLRSLALAMVSVDPRERPNGVAEVLRYLRPMLPELDSLASPKATRPDPTAPYRLGLSVP